MTSDSFDQILQTFDTQNLHLFTVLTLLPSPHPTTFSHTPNGNLSKDILPSMFYLKLCISFEYKDESVT